MLQQIAYAFALTLCVRDLNCSVVELPIPVSERKGVWLLEGMTTIHPRFISSEIYVNATVYALTCPGILWSAMRQELERALCSSAWLVQTVVSWMKSSFWLCELRTVWNADPTAHLLLQQRSMGIRLDPCWLYSGPIWIYGSCVGSIYWHPGRVVASFPLLLDWLTTDTFVPRIGVNGCCVCVHFCPSRFLVGSPGMNFIFRKPFLTRDTPCTVEPLLNTVLHRRALLNRWPE